MPNLGERSRTKRRDGNRYNYLIWDACFNCGKERWVRLNKGAPISALCNNCAGRLNGQRVLTGKKGVDCHNWKGGRVAVRKGYIEVWVSPDDFFHPMRNKRGYVLEHRLIVAKALGRCLLPWEVVHHKEGYAKDDNRYPETLELITDKRFHLVDAQARAYIKRLEKRVTLLEAEIILLQLANAVGGKKIEEILEAEVAAV